MTKQQKYATVIVLIMNESKLDIKNWINDKSNEIATRTVDSITNTLIHKHLRLLSV